MLYFIYFTFVSKYIIFIYVFAYSLIASCWTKMVGGGMRTRRGSQSTRRKAKKAQQDDDVQQQVEQQVAVDAVQQNNDDAQQDASRSDTSGSRNIYLRGPTSLPQRPIL